MARKRKVAKLPAAAQEGLPTECPHWRSSAARPSGNIGGRADPGTISAMGPLPAFSVEKRGVANHRCNHRSMAEISRLSTPTAQTSV